MNKLTATVEFDFKGDFYSLSTEVDVDKIIKHEDFYNSIYLAIAKEHNIGLYTYELEIMMDQDIVFSNEKGCSIGCIDNGLLNIKMLRDNHNKYLCKPIIHNIIHKYKLDKDNTSVVDALTEAYLSGKNS